MMDPANKSGRKRLFLPSKAKVLDFKLSLRRSNGFDSFRDGFYHFDENIPVSVFLSRSWTKQKSQMWMYSQWPFCSQEVFVSVCDITHRSWFSRDRNIHIISFEPISERVTSKSFPEHSVKSVRIDVIGTFWWATIRELYHVTGIGTTEIEDDLLIQNLKLK